MGEQNGFPKELLSASMETRKEYFARVTIAHPRLKNVAQLLTEQIRKPTGASIYMVLGPSGVGKTTLKNKIEHQFIDEFKGEPPTLGQGHIPIAGVELVSPDNGKFNWKDYYKRALKALNEPMIDKKVNENKEPTKGDNTYDPRTAPELRGSLENAFYYRKPSAFLIDEAQHFTKMASGRRLQDQLDTIKSMANMTGIVHVLIGTYELLPFVNLSGQLSRRTIDLHFPRYTIDSKKDIESFKSTIYTLQKYLPLEQEPDLLMHWEFIYERTLGCIGILKNWLERCLDYILTNKEQTITLETLDKHALSVAKTEKMAFEAINGEKQFIEDDAQRLSLQKLLGLSHNDVSEYKERHNHSRKNVGQRIPSRDRVGQGH